MLPSYLTETDSGCRLTLRVIPGAKKTAIVGVQGDALKLKVTAPPVDGAANKLIVAFLAKRVLKLPRSAVTIERGARSRVKVLSISAPAAAVAAALADHR